MIGYKVLETARKLESEKNDEPALKYYDLAIKIESCQLLLEDSRQQKFKGKSIENIYTFE